jgi:hypothetical protein
LTHTCPAPPPAAAFVEDGDGGGVVVAVGAGDGEAGAALVPQVCTPPWPRQAPLRVVPLKAVPSLQVAVTGAWAKIGAARPKETNREIANSRFIISCPYDSRDCHNQWGKCGRTTIACNKVVSQLGRSCSAKIGQQMLPPLWLHAAHALTRARGCFVLIAVQLCRVAIPLHLAAFSSR